MFHTGCNAHVQPEKPCHHLGFDGAQDPRVHRLLSLLKQTSMESALVPRDPLEHFVDVTPCSIDEREPAKFLPTRILSPPLCICFATITVIHFANVRTGLDVVAPVDFDCSAARPRPTPAHARPPRLVNRLPNRARSIADQILPPACSVPAFHQAPDPPCSAPEEETPCPYLRLRLHDGPLSTAPGPGLPSTIPCQDCGGWMASRPQQSVLHVRGSPTRSTESSEIPSAIKVHGLGLGHDRETSGSRD
ncbi:hypothetical protein OF83DRAFT_1288988 [Amylostereum chailletii]|nr:hypothetical protein OF83DRAFT_1288988 [Amylostereum chailletii]